jgi:hypothetical protein
MFVYNILQVDAYIQMHTHTCIFSKHINVLYIHSAYISYMHKYVLRHVF